MNGRRQVRYHTIMTPKHEVLTANGLLVESFYPGVQAMALLRWIERLQILALIPGVLSDANAAYGPLARPALTKRDVEFAARAPSSIVPRRELRLLSA